MKNYNEIISPLIASVPPSGIRKFFDIAAEMKDAISLGVGEPDFVTPWHIRNEGIYSLEKGMTYYTSNSGLKELRIEITNYLNRRFSLKYEDMVSNIASDEYYVKMMKAWYFATALTFALELFFVVAEIFALVELALLIENVILCSIVTSLMYLVFGILVWLQIECAENIYAAFVKLLCEIRVCKYLLYPGLRIIKVTSYAFDG